jgi:hypothetical protein
MCRLGATTFGILTLSIMTLSVKTNHTQHSNEQTLGIITLIIMNLYAECHIFVTLSVNMLRVVKLNVVIT